MDIHWYLFLHLKQDPTFSSVYGPELIRAEFPTRTEYPDSRGHYDLVILDPDSMGNPIVRALPPWAPWEEFLPLVDVFIAVEVKIWADRTTDIPGKADWDIQKLTDARNAVKHAYFLNFVQLDFNRPIMANFYRDLKKYLTIKASNQPNLRVLCRMIKQFSPTLRKTGFTDDRSRYWGSNSQSS
jgi:hypothetical protein